MMQMKGITKIYRTDVVETRALTELSLTIDAGEFVAVTGPSGSGKTTFLNIAGLLENFESGSYHLGDQDVSQLKDRESARIRNEKIGFIFQSFNLIPDLNLFDNVDVVSGNVKLTPLSINLHLAGGAHVKSGKVYGNSHTLQTRQEH